MADRQEKTFQIEDARIIFRNFTGEKKQFNAEGDRNFCVIIPDDYVEVLQDDGWNVKWLDPREEGDLPTPYVQISVAYKIRPPRVVMVTSRGQKPLNEETVHLLDFAELRKVDLIARAYEWVLFEGTPQEKRGTKAYLKTLYATVEEDELERKYASNDPNGE